MDVLNVYLNERHVGRLSETDGVLSFSYLPEYVAQGSGEPLSLVRNRADSARSWSSAS